MTRKTSPAYRASKEETIPINKLHPFSNHPFHIRHDLEFSELVDSISESGIITPIIVRPKVGVGYEVISGHRRWEACKELGIESIPARVEYIDDDEATILMVNSNIQREHVLPSEKAFAYKMRMEALKHQGRATLGQVVPKLKYNRSEAVIGEEVGESYKQVQRYIRLTYLIPSIMRMLSFVGSHNKEGDNLMKSEIRFKDREHLAFYNMVLKQTRKDDPYHKAFFYVVGISSDTRNNIQKIFDFEEDCIRPDCINDGWQTSGTERITRLAFNLWNGWNTDGYATPYDLFDCEFAPYFMEGIRLRYPEYCRELESQPPKWER